jgi:hypothetical protein
MPNTSASVNNTGCEGRLLVLYEGAPIRRMMMHKVQKENRIELVLLMLLQLSILEWPRRE